MATLTIDEAMSLLRGYLDRVAADAEAGQAAGTLGILFDPDRCIRDDKLLRAENAEELTALLLGRLPE